MNDRQRILLIVAGALVLIALTFPPFVVHLPNGAAINKGYGFLFDPPQHGYLSATVNVATLMAEWIGIAILGGVGWVLLKGGATVTSQSPAGNNSFGGAATQKRGSGSPKVLRAGFWARAGAYILDYILLCVGMFILFFFLALIGAMTPESGERSGTAWGILLFWLYFAFLESGPRQATIGKRALSIKVVTLEGRAPSFWRATGRHFAKILSGLFFCIGFLMCLFTAKKQCLHDIMASCLVVRDDATEQDILTALGQVTP